MKIRLPRFPPAQWAALAHERLDQRIRLSVLCDDYVSERFRGSRGEKMRISRLEVTQLLFRRLEAVAVLFREHIPIFDLLHLGDLMNAHEWYPSVPGPWCVNICYWPFSPELKDVPLQLQSKS